MSVKDKILITIAVLTTFGFITMLVQDFLKREHQLEFEKVELKSQTSKIQDLNMQYDQLNNRLQAASDKKEQSKERIDKLNEEKKELEAEKERLRSELQAKLDKKNKMQEATAKVANAVSNTSTASASGGGCSEWMKQAGITDPIAFEIVNKENRNCDPCVYNDGSPTGARDCNYSGGNAYGIPQSLPGSKMASEGEDWRTNPVTQLRWMQKYVLEKYGSWAGAQSHHNANGWY